MKRVTHMLAVLYTLTAVVLLRCAYASQENGSTLYACFFAGAAVLYAAALAHHAYHRDELRFALERAGRPPLPRRASAADGIVAVAMAGWCCDAWAATAGAEHAPATCTRKDSTA
jgi:hypothetical protein